MELFDVLVRYEVALRSAVDREAGRLNQDLSDDIGITVGAASKLVDRLERDGLVSKGPNPADRRSSLIALTTALQRPRARLVASGVGVAA